jgi:hypothetical protein
MTATFEAVSGGTGVILLFEKAAAWLAGVGQRGRLAVVIGTAGARWFE